MTISGDFILNVLLFEGALLIVLVVVFFKLAEQVKKLNRRQSIHSENFEEFDYEIIKINTTLDEVKNCLVNVEMRDYSVVVSKSEGKVRFLQCPPRVNGMYLDEARQYYQNKGIKSIEIQNIEE